MFPVSIGVFGRFVERESNQSLINILDDETGFMSKLRG